MCGRVWGQPWDCRLQDLSRESWTNAVAATCLEWKLCLALLMVLAVFFLPLFPFQPLLCSLPFSMLTFASVAGTWLLWSAMLQSSIIRWFIFFGHGPRPMQAAWSKRNAKLNSRGSEKSENFQMRQRRKKVSVHLASAAAEFCSGFAFRRCQCQVGLLQASFQALACSKLKHSPPIFWWQM